MNARIDELWAQTKAGNLPREERFKAIEQLTDEYIEATGNRPDPDQLDRLASLCLYEELSDDTPWKTQNTEYPIHSARQQEEIEKNEVNMAPPDKSGKPTRRKRSDYENTVANKAKALSKERRQKYREFTKTQPIMCWNMHTGEIFE
jgi:hypothetical protein